MIFIEDKSLSVKSKGAFVINRNKLEPLSNIFQKHSIISICSEEDLLTFSDNNEKLSIKIRGESISRKQQSVLDGEPIVSIQHL